MLYKILKYFTEYLLRYKFYKMSIFGAIRADRLGGVIGPVVKYVNRSLAFGGESDARLEMRAI